jgi:hypothetical protein
MTRRRERPLPKLQVSLEALPPPESKRTCRYTLSFSDSEAAMIHRAAEERGEQPAVLMRSIILTAFQNSAMRALAEEPDLLHMSPLEQQKALLTAFSIDEEAPTPAKPAKLLKRGAPARSRGRPPSR